MFLNNIKYIISIFKKITHDSTSFYSAYSNKYLNCGEISKNMCDQKIVLYGWLHNTRMKGNILLLRDHTGLVQLISNLNNKSFELPPLESVIKIEGHVKQRPEGQINKNMATGDVEILIDNLEVVNKAAKNLPFYIKDYHKSTELLRLKYRYIDLRRQDIQDRLRLRSKIEFYFCEFLIKMNNFVNVGTPSLFLSSPGGAREFIVPTKEPRMCYSLIQSPQQHKQLLMVGGLDKYMQLARCYRNEMSRPNRQPEFTQLDIEMSFVNQSHLQSLIEEMLVYSLKNFTELICPFPIITFDNSMRLYGTDRPDLRFDFEIKKYVISGKSAIGIHLEKDDYKVIDLNESSDTVNHRIEIIDCENCEIYSHQSLESIKKGFILMIPDSGNIQDFEFMGKLRSFIGFYLNSKGKLNYKNKFVFAWINKFPLFEMEEGVYKSLHHQFTSPIVEHIDFLYSDPTKVIGEQFDLVCNGIEIGGGSIRIHDSKIQEYIIKNILKEDVSCFDHLLSALKSGAPPHGGFALGVDRFISVLTGCNSIRDVIAFPKTADGKDLMSGAPTEITNAQSDYYCLKFSNEFKNKSA